MFSKNKRQRGQKGFLPQKKRAGRQRKKATWIIGMSSVIVLTLVSLAYAILNPYLSISLLRNLFPMFSATGKVGQVLMYGENIDMSQILPASQHYVVNEKGQDLIDIAASLGVRLVRITNGQVSFSDATISIYSKKQWDQVLDKMQKKGIKALIQLETAGSDEDYYSSEIRPAYLQLVQMYLDSGVFSHPDVFAVDIRNEPLLTEANLKMLEIAHNMIKSRYPLLKQTVGWWATPLSSNNLYAYDNYNWSDYAAGKELEGIVDFYSVHMYNLDANHPGIGIDPNLQTKVFISQVETGLQTNKPILIEEFGEANGDAISNQDTIGSPELQAKVYQGVYQALTEMHSPQIVGAIGYELASRNQHLDAWAIVKDRGNYFYPAALILREYALNRPDASLQAKTVITSRSYLFQNDSKNTSQSLQLQDRIGLKLRLDPSQTYTVIPSAPGILTSLDALYYDGYAKAYEAVYQATAKGQVVLRIYAGINCTPGGNCGKLVYTLHLIIR